MGTKLRRKKLTRKEKEQQVDRMPKSLIDELNADIWTNEDELAEIERQIVEDARLWCLAGNGKVNPHII